MRKLLFLLVFLLLPGCLSMGWYPALSPGENGRVDLDPKCSSHAEGTDPPIDSFYGPFLQHPATVYAFLIVDIGITSALVNTYGSSGYLYLLSGGIIEHFPYTYPGIWCGSPEKPTEPPAEYFYGRGPSPPSHKSKCHFPRSFQNNMIRSAATTSADIDENTFEALFDKYEHLFRFQTGTYPAADRRYCVYFLYYENGRHGLRQSIEQALDKKNIEEMAQQRLTAL